jgi:excinuclease ABC subunit A
MVQVEMQFLADLYLECEACRGKRYKQDALEVTYRGKTIYDVLEMTVDEACTFFSDQGRVASKLEVLRDIGLGYLKLGQPSNTLSGGEAQRIKLAVHLSRPMTRSTLYIFDEPTTGLHLDDIRRLLRAFNALVQKGHSVLLVEHNLDVIKCADWVIDMGPEGGMQGGKIVAEGTPEQLVEAGVGHTAVFLKQVMPGHA